MKASGDQRAGGAAEPEEDPLEQALRTVARSLGVVAARFVPSSEPAVPACGLGVVAEVPVVGAGGAALGRLRLLDTEPRPFGADAHALLADFAALVAGVVEREVQQRRAAQALREQGALLRQIVESLPVVVYTADRDGWFSISEGRGLDGLTNRTNAVGENMYERYRDEPEVLEPLRRTLAGSEEKFFHHIQGKIYEEWTAPLRDERGEVMGLVGVSMDVTEREAQARALRESEARLRSLVENTPVILFVLDRDGVLRVSEGRGLATIGVKPGEHVGLSAFDLYADLPEGLACVRRALAGEAVGWTLPLRGVYLETRLKPILDDAGAVTEVLGITYDVTERVKAEVALREATQRAEEANRMKSVFLANMSHEIRTPLTSILGFAELLADDVPPELSDVPGLIMQGGRRLMDTLNSVLDLARIESEQMELRLLPIDLAAEIAAAVRLLEPLAQQKGLRLEVRTLATPGPVLADAAALGRVVNNLVGNAIKFTRTGGVLVEVGAEGAEAVLRVRDTGEGIAEAFVPHLFAPFRQESDGLDRRHEGSGLGLAITRRLVELMGGQIEAASRKGEGSTFTVRLPRWSESGDSRDGGTRYASLAEAVRRRADG